jgi:glycosyltransferase involved in cell wall biosynthesis
MRLIFASNLRLPSEKAASLQSMTMCAEFARQVSVLLIAPKRKNKGPLTKQDPFSFYGIAKTFDLKELPCLDWQWLQFISDRLWFFLLNLSFLISAAIYLGWIARREDVLYTRDRQLLPVLARVRKQRGCRMYWECHAVPQDRAYAKLLRLRPDGIVSLTQAAKDCFLKHGFADNTIAVAHDGVHLNAYNLPNDRATLRKMLNLPAATTILTYVGRFQTLGKEKGILEIIHAASKLKERTDLLFLFVGGPMKAVSNYLELIRKLGIPETFFEFRDRLPNREVPAILKASDILLMPFPREPHYEINMSPLKMFEYMAAERPIIASDLATIREVLRPQDALFCDPDDALTLTAQIAKLLNETGLGTQLAINARERVQEYTWTKRAERILQFVNP